MKLSICGPRIARFIDLFHIDGPKIGKLHHANNMEQDICNGSYSRTALER